MSPDAAGIADGNPVTMILHVGDFAYNMGDAGGCVPSGWMASLFKPHRADTTPWRLAGTTATSSSTWSVSTAFSHGLQLQSLWIMPTAAVSSHGCSRDPQDPIKLFHMSSRLTVHLPYSATAV